MADDVARSRRLESVVEAALARPVGERADFLIQACRGDDDLRHEAASLLETRRASRHLPRHSLDAPAAGAIEGPSLVPGLRIGHYRIMQSIGEGGMGEVYQAADTRLDRQVALKLLPPEVRDDADRRARLTREAKAVAVLNHPNIVTMYAVEEVDGLHFITMELVRGRTMADLLPRTGFTLEKFFEIAIPLTDALAAAHQQGITHRDVKPTNVMVTDEGRVKVLDFGLAKAQLDALERDDTHVLPSITEDGHIVGTPAYMSPEQAEGKTVDARSDIFSLGIVFYEMLTGHRPFVADSATATLSAILHATPHPLTELKPALPRRLGRLVQRCLEKHPVNRYQSAIDLRHDLGEIRQDIDAADGTSGQPVPRSVVGRSRAVWPAAGVIAIGAAAVIGVIATRPHVEGARSQVATSILVERLNLGQPGVHFAVAPSGRTVVFTADYGGISVLFRRDLDRVDPAPIVGTEGGSDVFFSHDGRRLGYETGSELWTTPLDGGTPQRLLPNQPLRGGTWGEGDRIVFGRVGSGLWMVAAAGSEPRQLTRPGEGERHELPQLLPGGRAVLFTIVATNRPPRAAVYLLDSEDTRTLFEGIAARFVETGHVVFGQQGKLWAVGFHPGTLEILGEARPLRDDVLWSATGYPQFAVGADLLAYVRASQASSPLGNTVPVLVDRQGNAQALPLKAQNYVLGRLSPSGDRLIAQVGAARELWTYDLRRGASTKLTSDRIVAWSAPTWTPDGTRVIFTTWFDGEVGLGWLPADGSGPVEPLVKGIGMRSFEATHPVILPDSSGLILTGLAPGASADDLLFIPLTGEKRLTALLQASGVERNPAIDPNGRFVAYNSDDSGRAEVYVRPFPDVGVRKWQVSIDGGASPVWTRGGSELVYRDSLGRMMAVSVRRNGDDLLDFSTPSPLFSFGRGGGRGEARGFDVTADGERFLFFVEEAAAVESGTGAELILIQNWADELTRLVPRD
jgi:serine/threonine-protein kinase